MLLTLLNSTLIAAAFAAPTTHTVVMKSLSFDPKVLTVHAGDSVEWTDQSLTDHSATADDRSFDTGLIKPKQTTKRISFTKTGSVKYHCSVHGKTMSGVIEVLP